MSVRIIDFRKLFLEKIPPSISEMVEKMFDETLKEIKEINVADGDVGTEKCVICGKTAQIYSGHLHLVGKKCNIDSGDDDVITAGFCSEKCARESKDNVDNCVGCVGYYQSMYGKKKIEY